MARGRFLQRAREELWSVPQAGRLSGLSRGPLADLKQRKPFELYGYYVLNNHFHLLPPPKGPTISRIMQSLLVSRTQRYHRHYRSGGHVWQGRFKSPVIQNDEHLLTVLRYIEANPLRATLVQRADEYLWSSYRVHGLGEANELIDRLIT